MKSLFLFVFTCFMGYLACAQIPAPTFRWAVPISGALNIEAMKVTPAGDTYITGYFEDYICFDTTWAHCQEGLGEGTDQYIAKYNRDGVLQWAKVVGMRAGGGIGGSRSLEIDDKGDMYFSWTGYDTLFIGDFSLPMPTGFYGYTCKISSEGTVLFVDTYTTYWNRKFDAYANTVIGAGAYSTIPPYNPNDTVFRVAGATISVPTLSTGLLLTQTDRNNQMIRHKTFPSTDYVSIYNLETLTDGTILLHGSFKDSLTIGDTTFVARGTSDFFLFAFNHKFQLKWAEVYDNGFDNLYSSLVPDSNSFYFFGSISASSPTLWMGDTLLPRSTPYQIAAKISSNRKVAWRILTQVPGNAVCKLRNSLYMMSGGDGNAGDTLNFYDNQLIYPYDRFQSFIRLDDTLDLVWNKTVFVYDPNAPGIDRWAVPIGLDTLGYLYGQGGMRQFSIYLEDILVRPLFVTMGTYGEKFIFGMTRDSFLVPNPPPPPIDSISANWLLYPNPFTDMLYLSGEWQAGSLDLEIFDMAGRQIISKTFDIASAGKQKLICSLPAGISMGIYYAMLRQGTQNQGFKLMKL